MNITSRVYQNLFFSIQPHSQYLFN